MPALASLALALVEGSGSEDVPVIQVAARLGDELFRAAVEASLLVQNGNFVRFQHALMGMYFAAEALAEADVETLDRWCRANVRQWEAIAVAWSGISSRAEEFLVHSNWQDAAELIGLGFVASETALKKHVARALEDLSVDHWRSFQPAMDALIRMGPPAVPLLIDALGDANGDLRAKLAFVPGRIPDPRAASPLIASLDDPSEEVQGRALVALEAMATPEALAALAARTDDPSHERREAAARAIGKMADPRQAPLLRAMVADKSPSVRRAAAGSLGLLGDSESAPALLVLTDDAEAETRRVALRALLALGGSDHGPMVTKALADADDKVRLEALDGVRSLGIQAASAALLHALSDGSDAVRQRAAYLLAATGGERALEPLVQLLDQPKAAMVAAGAHALGTIGGPRARRLLLERLHSDSSIFWAPCSAALQAEGWLPTSPIDVVRDGAARGDWTGCLALGSGAVNELRAVLRLGDESMRRGAAATLHTMGWTPGEPNTEWFNYAVARADWQTEENQRPGERPSLLGWFKGHPLSRGPVRGLVEELLPSLTMPLAGRGLDEALSDSDLLRRYVATIAAGLASCDVAVPLLLDNLNAPDDDAHPVFHYGMIRVASAQALGEMKNLADVLNLLKHAACGIPSGVGTYSNFSAVTAVQSAWRCVGFADLFECIPALALGRKRENDSKRVVIDLWSHFPLADLSVLERYSVSAFVTALAAFDRSKLPAFSVLYSDFAFWELQTRLAVLALVCMAGTHETFFMHSDLKSAASLALTQLPSWSVEPVLREAEYWAGPAVLDFTTAEVQRQQRADEAVKPVDSQSPPPPPLPT